MAQDILVGIVIAAAVALAVRRYWRVLRGRAGGCSCQGRCQGCRRCSCDKHRPGGKCH